MFLILSFISSLYLMCLCSALLCSLVLCSLALCCHFRDAADLGVFSGVRKACFTEYTHMEQLTRTAGASSSSSRSIDGDVNGQHSASIVQVRSRRIYYYYYMCIVWLWCE